MDHDTPSPSLYRKPLISGRSQPSLKPHAPTPPARQKPTAPTNPRLRRIVANSSYLTPPKPPARLLGSSEESSTQLTPRRHTWDATNASRPAQAAGAATRSPLVSFPQLPPKQGLPASVLSSYSNPLQRTRRPDAPFSPRLALTPAFVLEHYGADITEYEHTEILDYTDVYFWGRAAGAPIPRYASSSKDVPPPLGPGAHVFYRYEVIELLERGDSTVLWDARDYKSGKRCLLKMVLDAPGATRRSFREIAVLKTLRKGGSASNMGVAKCHNSFCFRGCLFITFETLGLPLRRVLEATRSGLRVSEVRKICIQVTNSILYFKKLGIIHGLIDAQSVRYKNDPPAASDCTVKVFEFAAAITRDAPTVNSLAENPRCAPEVVLKTRCGHAVDIWSLGCLVLELFLGFPVIKPVEQVDDAASGQRYLKQVAGVIGPPSEDFVARAPPRARALFMRLRAAPARPSVFVRLQASHGEAAEQLLQFARCCMRWDPASRLAPEAALAHPFLGVIEPTAPRELGERSILQKAADSLFSRLQEKSAATSAARPLS